ASPALTPPSIDRTGRTSGGRIAVVLTLESNQTDARQHLPPARIQGAVRVLPHSDGTRAKARVVSCPQITLPLRLSRPGRATTTPSSTGCAGCAFPASPAG